MKNLKEYECEKKCCISCQFGNIATHHDCPFEKIRENIEDCEGTDEWNDPDESGYVIVNGDVGLYDTDDMTDLTGEISLDNLTIITAITGCEHYAQKTNEGKS